ncbi:MAG TPA: YibE/F family protein [Candidatus Paceibacterota bacterium]|nr:YibE/F family protein [Candidatus Paceibacterota bacterium]HMP19111.1 YibE/F family protein [Candidatus Paceibacterota bacterium]HMP85115.1 YibE/F family protein [Candidatus Paceibacterota bacterium]
MLIGSLSKVLLFLIFIFTFFFPTQTFSQEIHNDYQGTFKAKIIKVISEEKKDVGWNNVLSTYRNIDLKFLEGPKKGVTVNIETDFPELSKGDRIFVNYLIDVGGKETYSITNIDRTNQIWFLIILFILVIILFGGWQGFRSLIALIGSFIVILYVLLPSILSGWHPLFVSVLIASAILFFAIFFTHGFNKESLVAYSGTMIAVMLTSLLALFAVSFTKLSGLSDDSALYLNFNTGGELNFTGLLLGAIIVGVLGVLDDIAITQAAVVSELYDSNKNISRIEVYKRAMRVGREHVGALVNTLVLAYTGAALPVMLLVNVYKYDFETIINLEIFATEIVRTIVGSIGLVLTVPIVTFLAVYFLKGYKSKHSHHHH